MGKRLTPQEKEERMVQKIINSFKKNIERRYGFDMSRRACNRYFEQVRNKKKLEQEISERERKLQELKSRR